MQIFYSVTSPFARKVSMFAKATQTPGIQWCRTNPMESSELREVNPLGKVPALLDGDLAIFESSLICEYLDDIYCAHGGHSLFHKGHSNYYRIQLAHVTANGILDAAVAALMERRRVDAEQSTFWLQRWDAAIEGALTAINLQYCGDAQSPNIATIALTAALGYLDFRHPVLDWRMQRSDLKYWLEDISTTNWYRETLPETEIR